MTTRRIASAVVFCALAATLGFATAGCEKKGPAERAGEKIDNVADKIDDAVDPKGPVEKLGRKVDRAVDRD